MPGAGGAPAGAQGPGRPPGNAAGGGGTGLKPGKGFRPGYAAGGSGDAAQSPGSLAPRNGPGLSSGESQNGTKPHPAGCSQCHAQWQSARAGAAASSSTRGKATVVSGIMLCADPAFPRQHGRAAVSFVEEQIVTPLAAAANSDKRCPASAGAGRDHRPALFATYFLMGTTAVALPVRDRGASTGSPAGATSGLAAAAASAGAAAAVPAPSQLATVPVVE